MGAPVKKRKKAGKTDARGGTREGKKHGRGPPPVRKSIPPVEGYSALWDDGKKNGRQPRYTYAYIQAHARIHIQARTLDTRYPMERWRVTRASTVQEHSRTSCTD